MRKYLTYLVALGALSMCVSANAAIIQLFANLTRFEEQPTGALVGPGATPIGPTAGELKPFLTGPTSLPAALTGDARPVSSGFATFTIDDNPAAPSLTFSAIVFNIDFSGNQTPGVNDNLTAAHIHAGPPGTAIPGVSAAPVVWGFFGAPFNDLINPPPLFPIPGDCVPFASGVGGTCSGTWDATEGNNTTLIAQLENILEGRSYINFHTAQFAGGEIRGQLRVPEPGSLALLACALGGVYFVRRQLRTAHARV